MVCKSKWAKWAKDLEDATKLSPSGVDGARRCWCNRPLLKSGQCVVGHAQGGRDAAQETAQRTIYATELAEALLCAAKEAQQAGLVDPTDRRFWQANVLLGQVKSWEGCTDILPGLQQGPALLWDALEELQQGGLYRDPGGDIAQEVAAVLGEADPAAPLVCLENLVARDLLMGSPTDAHYTGVLESLADAYGIPPEAYDPSTVVALAKQSLEMSNDETGERRALYADRAVASYLQLCRDAADPRVQAGRRFVVAESYRLQEEAFRGQLQSLQDSRLPAGEEAKYPPVPKPTQQTHPDDERYEVFLELSGEAANEPFCVGYDYRDAGTSLALYWYTAYDAESDRMLAFDVRDLAPVMGEKWGDSREQHAALLQQAAAPADSRAGAMGLAGLQQWIRQHGSTPERESDPPLEELEGEEWGAEQWDEGEG